MAHGRVGKIDNYRRLKSAVIAANAPKSLERSFYDAIAKRDRVAIER